MENAEKHFFASANSGLGFVNRFDDIFADLEHHYIIKGGSGTGKSTFMKKIAQRAELEGMNIEYYHCSSDADSLDGIIIKELGIGVTDGTAPHTSDPKFPGAKDEIINVGLFWDKRILKENRNEIIRISNRKSFLFKEVYNYLNSALTLENTIDRLNFTALKNEKMDITCDRIIKTIPNKSRGKEIIRLTEAITMNGMTRYDPYLNEAKTVYAIRDKYRIAHIFLEKIYSRITALNIHRIISYSPLDPSKINMIYLPEEKILFSINPEYKDNEKTINMDRFVDKEKYREVRELLRYTQGCEKRIMTGAYILLENIKALHFELESIYIKSMDFAYKDECEANLINEIFG